MRVTLISNPFMVVTIMRYQSAIADNTHRFRKRSIKNFSKRISHCLEQTTNETIEKSGDTIIMKQLLLKGTFMIHSAMLREKPLNSNGVFSVYTHSHIV